jgi:hypothetical protein
MTCTHAPCDKWCSELQSKSWRSYTASRLITIWAQQMMMDVSMAQNAQHDNRDRILSNLGWQLPFTNLLCLQLHPETQTQRIPQYTMKCWLTKWMTKGKGKYVIAFCLQPMSTGPSTTGTPTYSGTWRHLSTCQSSELIPFLSRKRGTIVIIAVILLLFFAKG